MVARKIIGLGTRLEVDEAGGSDFSFVSLIGNMTPAGHERAETVANALEDLLEVPVPGIESQSELVFLQYWYPGDTDHEKIDVLFKPGALQPDIANWRVTFPHEEPATFHPTETFLGYVRQISKEAVDPAGVISRTVSIRRTDAITKASTTITVEAVNDPP